MSAVAPAALRPRKPNRRTLERQAMTREEELELLIAEQAADDVYYVKHEFSGTVSLDAALTADDGHDETLGSTLIGGDPWEATIDALDAGTDPSEESFIFANPSNLVSYFRPQRGEGLADPSKIPHGTPGGYANHKCRCTRCKTRWARYFTERRAARKGKR